MSSSHSLATLGGGCFWCTEAVFTQVRGVTGVVSGYANGHVENPTYKQVCTGKTGHVEVVQISFDPQAIDYATLLRIFLDTHDPTTLNRQGADVGTQYRSAILTHHDQQAAVARAVLAELAAEAIYEYPIVTTIEPLIHFYPAEDYHQHYFANNPTQPYCSAVVGPKVAKFRKQFADYLLG